MLKGTGRLVEGAAQVCAKAREMRRRKTSPVAMPRTLPSGFRSAVILASAWAAETVSGTRALASTDAAYASSSRPSASR